MAVFFAPIPWQFLQSSGLPLSGGQLFTYQAGTTTQQPTFTDSTGLVQNANPIVLNSLGMCANEVWLTSGQAYKFVLEDANNNVIWTRDNVSGVNDITTSSTVQWLSGPTPTYISGTQLTVVGNQTGTFQVGRRIQVTETAGTQTGYITASSYNGGTNKTTLTVQMDNGTLDNGLSTLNYGIITGTQDSVPRWFDLENLMLDTSTTSNLYSGTVSPQQQYVQGMKIKLMSTNGWDGLNSGGCTVNVNGLGAKPICRKDGTPLQFGDIPVWSTLANLATQNIPAEFIYDGTQFRLHSPTAQYMLRRNLLLNGGFNIAQGTMTGGTATGASPAYLLDQWAYFGGTGGTMVVQQNTFAAGTSSGVYNPFRQPQYYNSMIVSGSPTSSPGCQQGIEGVRTLAGQFVAASFWAWCGSGTMAVALFMIQNFGTGGSPSGQVVVSLGTCTLTNTPTHFIQIGTLPGLAGKTIGSNQNTDVTFFVVNMPTAVGTMNWTQAQLEPGEYATDFEDRSNALELFMCRRFYEIRPALNQMNVTSGVSYNQKVQWSSQKRVTPTVGVTVVSTSGFPASVTTNGGDTDHVQLVATANATTNGGFWQVTATADARF